VNGDEGNRKTEDEGEQVNKNQQEEKEGMD
jgi:hypothetical protein